MRSYMVTPIRGLNRDTATVRTMWAVAVALVLALLAPPWALAAEEPLQLTSSEPATVAELDAPPQEIVLTFNAPLAKVKALVVVEGQKFEDDPTPEGNIVRVPVPPNSPAGEYRVTYDAVGVDEKTTSGSLAFTVTAAGAGDTTPDTAEPSTAPTPAESENQGETESSGGVSSIVWVVVGLLILGVALLVLLNSQPRKRAKRRREADADHL